MRISRLGALTLLIVAMASSGVRAEDGVEAETGFGELALGLEGAIGEGDGVNVLLRFEGGVEAEDGLVVARFRRAEAALDPDDPAGRVPYFEFSVQPVVVDAVDGDYDIAVRVLPVELSRDTRMGRDLRIRAQAVGLELEHVDPLFSGDEASLIARLSVDMVGIAHEWQTELEPHGGINLAGGDLELGGRFRINGAISMTVTGSAAADATFATVGPLLDRDSTGNVIADLSAGGEVRLHFRMDPNVSATVFGAVHHRARIETGRDGADGSVTEMQVGAGLRF